MSIRDTLLANVTVALNNTSCGVSTELPFETGGVALYEKNMKKFYLGAEVRDVNTLYQTLGGCNIHQLETTLTGFLSVDAKNQPNDISAIIISLINAKDAVPNKSLNECVVDHEIVEDRMIYSFEYTFSELN